MKPFFGLSNRLACIIISFVIFGYAVFSIFNDGIFSAERSRDTKIKEPHFSTIRSGLYLHVNYDFDSTSASSFGLYELELAMVKVCISFLLFIVLLVGATQRSKLLLRLWMAIHAVVIVLGFLTTIMTLTEISTHRDNSSAASNHTVNRFLITLAFSLWFFAVVLAFHEEVALEEEYKTEACKSKSHVIIAKKGSMSEDKCPPYYDC